MKNSKKIFAAIAIALMATVASQAASFFLTDDSSGVSRPASVAVSGSKTIYAFLDAGTDNGTVFEAMVGWTTSSSPTGLGGTPDASNLSVDNASVLWGAAFPKLFAQDNSIVIGSAKLATGRAGTSSHPYGMKVIGGVKQGYVPTSVTELFHFTLNATGSGTLVLSDAGSGNSYTTAFKYGSNSFRGAASLGITAAVSPAPVFQSAVSRKTHGTAGTFDIAMPLAGTGIECRLNGPTLIVMTFDQAVSKAADFAVTCDNATVVSSTTSGSTLQITLSGAINKKWSMINVVGLQGAGTAEGSYSLRVGSLYCDVNYSKKVDGADVIAVKAANSGLNVTQAKCQWDVNCSGKVDGSDVIQAKAANSGIGLP